MSSAYYRVHIDDGTSNAGLLLCFWRGCKVVEKPPVLLREVNYYMSSSIHSFYSTLCMGLKECD